MFNLIQMTQDSERIIDLFSKRILGTASPQELRELEEWIGNDPDRKLVSEKLSDMESLAEAYRMRALVNPSNALHDMRNRIKSGAKNRRWIKVGAWTIVGAAALFGVIWTLRPIADVPAVPDQTFAEHTPRTLSIDSIGPGETVAFITEGGIRKPVELKKGEDEISAEQLRRQSGTTGEVTLEVPRGGEFVVVLEDSTRVWLNSASTLTYPENFTADSRRVNIKGEAYFSISADKDRPFFVECEGQEIQVYGTEFNVRAYPEEESVFTSLSSGSVALRRIDHIGGDLVLSPGKQAVFNKTSLQAEVHNVNIETVTGWRHGRFVFENQTLFQIMSDLARWYDFDFEFADPALKDMVFMGSIPRYGNFSTAILILGKSGNVKFHTDGRKIIIDRSSK